MILGFSLSTLFCLFSDANMLVAHCDLLVCMCSFKLHSTRFGYLGLPFFVTLHFTMLESTIILRKTNPKKLYDMLSEDSEIFCTVKIDKSL